MKLRGKKIGILIEGDYFEPEIWYYKLRFAEEGAEVRFLSRMWGNSSDIMASGFKGHEHRIPFNTIGAVESFEEIDDAELMTYAAIIVPAGMVADRLRYTEDVGKIPPASAFMKRAFEHRSIIKGIICHGMWLMSPVSEVVKGRKAVVHNNLIGDAKNYGLEYIDEDLVVDGDLVTGRTGGHCNIFARKIIDMLE